MTVRNDFRERQNDARPHPRTYARNNSIRIYMYVYNDIKTYGAPSCSRAYAASLRVNPNDRTEFRDARRCLSQASRQRRKYIIIIIITFISRAGQRVRSRARVAAIDGHRTGRARPVDFRPPRPFDGRRSSADHYDSRHVEIIIRPPSLHDRCRRRPRRPARRTRFFPSAARQFGLARNRIRIDGGACVVNQTSAGRRENQEKKKL